ncbi:uncharacterized protein, partial [Amphiura filiformis]|uniref:uncharacterized protein n=1 Tax=Amphiura filiformis TaxID=82378 RepID=UPI003B217FAF
MATSTTDPQQWIAHINSFRRNPASFLASKQIEEEDFVLDVLQALYSEELGDAVKVMLLTLLQERAAFLHITPASVEQTIGSLTNIYNQTTSEDTSLYRSQLLVTITTILLDSNQL